MEWLKELIRNFLAKEGEEKEEKEFVCPSLGKVCGRISGDLENTEAALKDTLGKLGQEEELNKNLSKKIMALEKEVSILTTKPSALDQEYWETKYKVSKVYYSAPKKKWVVQYISYREIEGVTKLAQEIIKKYKLDGKDVDAIANSWNKWAKINIQSQVRPGSSKEWRFAYKNEIKEIWRDPEETLRLGYGDCDDYMILGYFVLRKILMHFGLWDKHYHRLKCQDVHVFSNGMIPVYAGRHANMMWLHSDSEWYTLETTYWTTKATINFGKIPQKLNKMYGLINYTMHDKKSFSHHSITLGKRDYGKPQS